MCRSPPWRVKYRAPDATQWNLTQFKRQMNFGTLCLNNTVLENFPCVTLLLRALNLVGKSLPKCLNFLFDITLIYISNQKHPKPQNERKIESGGLNIMLIYGMQTYATKVKSIFLSRQDGYKSTIFSGHLDIWTTIFGIR